MTDVPLTPEITARPATVPMRSKKLGTYLYAVVFALGLIAAVWIVGWLIRRGPSSASSDATPTVVVPVPQKASLPETEIPLTSWPPEKWKVKELSARETIRIAVPPDMHVVVKGNSLQLYNVYKGGKRCAFGDRCEDGALEGVDIENLSAGQNFARYAYEMGQ